MADVTSKKSLILLLFALVFSFTAFSQRNSKFSEFSNEFPTYLSQVNTFMTASNNDQLRSVYKQFSKSCQALSEAEKLNLVRISNKMLLKRLKPNPHFSKFLSAVVSINNSDRREGLLIEWLRVFDKAVDDATINKLMLFCSFTNDLVSKNILRASKTAQWRISSTNFHFKV